jgi:hypothetical protein
MSWPHPATRLTGLADPAVHDGTNAQAVRYRHIPDAYSFRYTLLISGRSALDGEELPAAWDPFQVVPASILELNARASNQVLHCGRNQYLARSGQG